VSYADLKQKSFPWHRLFPLLDKLPLWASYFFIILCSFGIGYSLGSANASLTNLRADHRTLAALTIAALLFIFFLDRTLRNEERRRADRAERLRVSKEAVAIELLDPVEPKVLDELDRIASYKGVDRATLIPAILQQYVARKSFEAALREGAAQGKGAPEHPPGWDKTLPAWLETLPGSLDVKSR